MNHSESIILHTVLKFQVDRGCFQGGEPQILVGKWNKKKEERKIIDRIESLYQQLEQSVCVSNAGAISDTSDIYRYICLCVRVSYSIIQSSVCYPL